MSTLVEKSKDMDARYEGGIDTWGNRERRLYQKILKSAVQKINNFLLESGKTNVSWYDIGCGGGNVWDTVKEFEGDLNYLLEGCDISEVACEDLLIRYQESRGIVTTIDLEEYVNPHDHFDEESLSISTNGLGPVPVPYLNVHSALSKAGVVSLVDVAYYFGEKRPWKVTMDEIWNSISPGTLILVADSLIPYQRRSYFGTKEDCCLLDGYTDYTTPVSEETRDDGKKWHRYLKIKIYKKV